MRQRRMPADYPVRSASSGNGASRPSTTAVAAAIPMSVGCSEFNVSSRPDAASAHFFLSRDIYATIVFHNFLGVFGVVQALAASGRLET